MTQSREYSCRRWTPAEVTRLLQMDAAGIRPCEIAHTLKRSQGSISMRLAREGRGRGLEGRRPPLRLDAGRRHGPWRRWTREEIDCMVRAYEAGETASTIASTLGRAVSAVRTKLMRLDAAGYCTPSTDSTTLE